MVVVVASKNHEEECVVLKKVYHPLDIVNGEKKRAVLLTYRDR